MRVASRHAVVTGGGSGIGAAIAEALVAAGTTVTILGRGESQLAETAGRLNCAYQVADVSEPEAVRIAFEAIAERHGDVDVLVNNAGNAEARPFAKTDDAHWHSMIGVNLHGVYYCTRAVVPAMLAAGYGRIVNVASTAGVKGYSYVSAYCAAKHGVIGLTRALAAEFAKSNITVNAVCPGYARTALVDRSVDKIVAATGRSRDEALAELAKSNPQGRLIEPEEVAAAVIWLLDEHTSSITGQAIAVAGGEIT
ncbi:MAG: SDR family oxidoreductase [Gammaproteobacteria bacterium]|nr:SDR family oxidoreductase [Gammaproteobacteria bacterium]